MHKTSLVITMTIEHAYYLYLFNILNTQYSFLGLDRYPIFKYHILKKDQLNEK